MRKTMSINKRNQQEHTEISLKKIHKHFKNLETKTKIVVFFFNNFLDWLTFSQTHPAQSSPDRYRYISAPKDMLFTVLDLHLRSMSSTSQVDL